MNTTKRRLFSIAATILLLSACASTQASVTYKLGFSNFSDTEEIRTELIQQSLRVMERRLQAMNEPIIDKELNVEDSTIALTVENEEALDVLTGDMQEAFDLQIMQEAAPAEAEITVEGHGGFKSTGITGADLEWVNARQQEGSDMGEVRLVFTEEGRNKMSTLFQENVGKNIGLFVRGLLVSKLQVETAELKDEIVIRDIPLFELAQTFADDVNVGLHVTFTPVP